MTDSDKEDANAGGDQSGQEDIDCFVDHDLFLA